MNRLKLFIEYLQNNRINKYENIIENALKNNYQVISLRDYAESNYDKNKKILVLRHDVDHFSKGTKMMFEVEKKHKVHSSFYFRNSTYEPSLMKDIEAYGSESSLHFEPIADFVKANPAIKNREDLFKTDFKQKSIQILKANIDRFRLLCDLPCVTIASHGEYENSLVSTPNNYLTENIDTYEYLGIKLEAYNKEMLEKVTCYISDVPIEENGGYKYGITPFEAIKNEEQFIMFLSHPNHWHYSKWKQFRKLVKIIIKKPVNENMEFKRI
jgi:peptidoglycan/xylan/chitin deacetylase (PgdA/CDA1 family)